MLEHVFEALCLHANSKGHLERLGLEVKLSTNQQIKTHNFRVSGGSSCEPDISIFAARSANKVEPRTAAGVCKIQKEQPLIEQSLKQLIMYMVMGQCSMRKSKDNKRLGSC